MKLASNIGGVVGEIHTWKQNISQKTHQNQIHLCFHKFLFYSLFFLNLDKCMNMCTQGFFNTVFNRLIFF